MSPEGAAVASDEPFGVKAFERNESGVVMVQGANQVLFISWEEGGCLSAVRKLGTQGRSHLTRQG